MDKAKQAVSDVLHRSGKHDTTVHETVAPAVTQEKVAPTRHEEVTTAVDREIHQDHHHTSVQPIHDREVLPEKHIHQQAAGETRTFDHSDPSIKDKVAAEAAQFRNERVVGETTHTQANAPTVSGEHVHHHVHETIQPVIQKETIQPEVVHTTVPVHEVHHQGAQHHSTSALPAVSMDEFKQQGGTLGGREERVDGFAGEPKSIGGNLGSSSTTSSNPLSSSTGTTGAPGLGSSSTGGMTGTGTTSLPGHGSTTGKSTDLYDNTSSTTSGTQKASLLDKINPKKDATGDGQAGFMK